MIARSPHRPPYAVGIRRCGRRLCARRVGHAGTGSTGTDGFGSARFGTGTLDWRGLALLLALSLGAAGGPAAASDSAAEEHPADPIAAGPAVDFTKQIQPILARRCYACHGPDQAEGGLELTSRERAVAETDSGLFAIVPGDPAASGLIQRITTEDEGERMPPEGDPLSEAETELLTRWIAQGASWAKPWAFEPRGNPQPPAVDDPLWSKHPVDAFIFASLAQAGLRPSPPADRRTLIRRAYYDLIGLPPTPQEVEAFVASDDPRAYEKLIDHLLLSPHYGERWGRHWLDLVRFAETNSFERDGPKPNAWKYRDYVIRAFNDDKPYGQFVREQLAGDELPEVTAETLTATGYYRLGIWDDEPADPLQARYDELDDLIATTSQVFLGLTVDCARCHDHKIDPIPQADYYSLLAFFADVRPYGTRADQTGNNQIDVSSEELKQRYADNDRRRREVETAMRLIEQEGIAKMPAPDQRATEGTPQQRQRVLDRKLREHLEEARWQQHVALKEQLERLQQELRGLPPREQVLGLANCDPRPEPTYVLFRGNPHVPAQEVAPAFPSLFGEAPPPVPNASPDARSAQRRRILADWIVDPENRLTWRVMANRVWQYHFGRGIVQSSNNFGQLGTPASHPELLDYLANVLVAEGGRLKPLHRLIMTSRAYQMASAVREEALAVDPANELLWRFEPRRLSAEEVRDSVLAVAGTLNRSVYGPSVYPRLSREVLAGQSQPGQGWGKSSPADQHRRSIYIHVKRSLLTPLLSAFDLPEPDRSCEARFTTLQPGQALALLNGDFIHEQASHLAARLQGEQASDEELVGRAIHTVLARDATAQELVAGQTLIAQLQSEHSLSRGQAIDLLCLTVLNWNEFVFLD